MLQPRFQVLSPLSCFVGTGTREPREGNKVGSGHGLV